MKRVNTAAFRKLLRLPPSQAEVERDVQEELRFHIDSRILALEMRGESPERAREIAHREFGDLTASRKELTRVGRRIVARQQRSNFLDVFRQDLAYACRGLVRSPGLTIAIIITLGLGVGANAAVFTVIDRLFFQTPPGVVDGDSIRRLYAHRYRQDAPQLPDGQIIPNLRSRDLFDLQVAARGMARIEGDYLWRRGQLMPSKERMLISFVTPGFFELLGVRAGMGRLFTPDENSLTGPSVPVVVISHLYWRKHFASQPDVIGKTLRVDENGFSVIFTVIGVASPEFEGLEVQTVDMWAPLGSVEGGVQGADALHLLAKVKPGTNIRELDRALTAQYRATHRADGTAIGNSAIISAPIMAARAPAGTLNATPGIPERNLKLLTRIAGIGVVVLIISVANVASLLLMRAVRRRREIAVRLALGISRGRLLTQVLIESALVGMVGGAAALLIAALTARAFRLSISTATFRWPEGVIDHRLVFVTAVLAIASGVLSGLAPAFFAMRADVGAYLKSSSAAGTRSGTTLRNGLLIIQSGLCMALIASAGVFVQSLRRAGSFDRGFDRQNVVQIEIRKSRADAEQRLVQIESRLREVPGVESVGRTTVGFGDMAMTSKVGPNYRDT
ncbi:MAG: ABC transporter permease, partial [Phycisphaerae bacterium]|nr:ABC transporter permease [Gemmatimonadaceae bacterium]